MKSHNSCAVKLDPHKNLVQQNRNPTRWLWLAVLHAGLSCGSQAIIKGGKDDDGKEVAKSLCSKE